jgi:hypothetical protein
MVTKMKMFGFMPTGTKNSQQQKQHAVSENSLTKATSSNFNMKNMASLMKVTNTGCKSCRG